MSKNKILVLSSQFGEWEGLFIDGLLVDEGHSLGEADAARYWIDIANEYNITSEDLITEVICDEDEKELSDYGSFPKNLTDLEGKYYD